MRISSAMADRLAGTQNPMKPKPTLGALNDGALTGGGGGGVPPPLNPPRPTAFGAAVGGGPPDGW
ncbi:MAG: hypothetical protein OXG67_17550, partial [bacterium]|nr:hypothetical protein [bacterium]